MAHFRWGNYQKSTSERSRSKAMLFNSAELEAIRSGKVSLAFRRWRRPTVKAGGTLMTPVGLLSIDRLTIVEASHISGADAAKSGHDLASLLSDLNSREGDCYRIDFHFIGRGFRLLFVLPSHWIFQGA
jgi:hypothetical protein